MIGRFIIAIGLLVAACDGNDAGSRQEPAQPASRDGPPKVALVTIAPGGETPVREHSAEAAKYDGDPEQIAAGKQLYAAFNCVGCHFNGGGGMGPPLMDDKWIYGSSMENIGATIREGRPAGMPSFRAMVVDEQVWQLAAYVRSLSGLGKPGAGSNETPTTPAR
jgi:cytochrome c oxidase cbb3-type subunit 3